MSVIVISGPSGVGKGTVCQKVHEISGIKIAISVTSREKRAGEKEGREYYYIDENEFRDKIEAGDFLEYAVVYGHYYGTLKTEVEGSEKITDELADMALSLLEVDKVGLDHTDRRMLDAMIKKFNGGPVGLETIAASISETRETIEDIYEPYLLQQGFLTRTPRGRCVTRRAYDHLGITPMGQQQFDL